jgi:hypothetical protein
MRDRPTAFRLLAKTTMSAPLRALVACLALMLTLVAAIAGDGPPTLGGFICAKPFVPTCEDERDTYRTAEDMAACQRDLNRYAIATAAYRDCLERQIAGAFREANDVLDRFRCLSRGACPPVAKAK